tara:strand:- start:65 stop:472 length:408 start_codon:yes stop_codon:yes gene_type:complete
MELIYFISGILTVGIVYGVNLLRYVKSSHTELLAKYQSQSNISSIRFEDLRDEVKKVEDMMVDIQSSMEKDQYANMSEINTKLEELFGITESNARKQNDSNKIHTKNTSDAFNEIQQLKNNLKVLGQDPNFLNRY